MAVSFSGQGVHAAVVSLYFTQDPVAREQANEYLLQFTETTSAWSIALELLNNSVSSSLEVQYFTANVLYTKVTRDWGQLQQQGAATVASFSANLLLFLKHYIEHHHHHHQQQQQQQQCCPSNEERLVIFRVCLTLTALSIKSPQQQQDGSGGGILSLLQEAFHFLGDTAEGVTRASQLSILIGLSLVRCLAEEIDRIDMSRTRRTELQSTLKTCVVQVLQVVEAILCRRMEMAQLALETLEAWLDLNAVTLSNLMNDTPVLFQQLCTILTARADAFSSSASPAVFRATCKVLARLSSIPDDPRSPGRGAAVEQLFAAVLTGWPTMTNEQQHEDMMYSFASFIIELCSQEAHELATGGEGSQRLQMVDVLLALTNHENMHISTLSLDFWDALGEVPLDERDARLGLPLYSRLVELLMGRLSYPPGFTSWDEECNMDPEDFTRYREGDLMKELLESCCAFSKAQYFMRLCQELEARGDIWQVAEVALLMLQQVARVTVTYIENGQAEQHQDRLLTAQIVVGVLHKYLSSPALYAQHPLVLQALLRLVGSYRALLLSPSSSSSVSASVRGKASHSVSLAVLNEEDSRVIHRLAVQCTLQGLSTTDAGGRAAASAFRSVCVGALSSGILANDPEALRLVMEALPTASASGQGITVRLVLIEATVRTLLAVSGPEDLKRNLLTSFTEPILTELSETLAALFASGSRTPQLLQSLAEDLQQIGEVIRFLDIKVVEGERGGSHIAQQLVQEIWPLLERTAQVAREGRNSSRAGSEVRNEGSDSYSSVLDQLFHLYSYMIVGLGSLVAPHMSEILSVILQLYGDTIHEGALETVGHVVEIFKEGCETDEHHGGEKDIFAHVFSAMAARTFDYMKCGHPPSECPGLVVGFFDMSLRYLSFRPTVFFSSQEFVSILDLALICLETKAAEERESTRSVLRVLRDVMKQLQGRATTATTSPFPPPYFLRSLQLLSERGQRLVTRSLTALARDAPSILWGNYFEFFSAFLQAWPLLITCSGSQGHQASSLLGEWVQTAVFDPNVLQDGAFSTEDRWLLVELIGNLGVGQDATRNKQKLKLLLDDVSKISSSEIPVQALQGYHTDCIATNKIQNV